MHCKDGKALELTVAVTLAPGILSGYTKIVRFLPRYVFVNTLPYPLRLWQDSSIFRPPASDHTSEAVAMERKWRITRNKQKRNTRKVNQYETLFDRETVLGKSLCTVLVLSLLSLFNNFSNNFVFLFLYW